jgi:hypothetical protein
MFHAETYFYLGSRYILFQNRCRVGKGPYTIQLAQHPSYRKGVTHSTYSAEFEDLWIIALCMTRTNSSRAFLYRDTIICLHLTTSDRNMAPSSIEMSPKYGVTIGNCNYRN